MKHHQYCQEFDFVKDPIEFNKFTDKDMLQFCLGATLYMPGNKSIVNKIINKELNGLTSMVLCFEDAISENDLPEAERNVIGILETISNKFLLGDFSHDDIPLIFIRVRNPAQFKEITNKFSSAQLNVLTGFVFPKFTASEGSLYLEHLRSLTNEHNVILYGMPILESWEIALKEMRINELIGILNLLKPFRDLILNVRVGATDLSSIFGVRRGIDYSIYDILTVRDCLSDILNFLSREGEDYVVSAPVWEYFLADKHMKFASSLNDKIHTSLLNRNVIVDDAIDGLLREVILDKANGFVGKTVIHPTHVKYVNAMHAVTREEFDDAIQILQTSGGVIKSASENKMNEINPHRSWAKRIFSLSKVYGVIQNEGTYIKLFS